MAPSVIGTAYIRNLYRRIYPQDVPAETAPAERAPVLLVGRMSVPAELEATFNDAYNHERLPLCQRIPGYIRARRFEAVMGEPKFRASSASRFSARSNCVRFCLTRVQ